MRTAWSEYQAPAEATTDRGWFKALCEPYDARHLEYTHETMPVWDEDVNAWREQATLGNYLDYTPFRTAKEIEENGGAIHCVCYVSSKSRYVRTVEEAREWIETEALKARPALAIQGVLVGGAA